MRSIKQPQPTKPLCCLSTVRMTYSGEQAAERLLEREYDTLHQNWAKVGHGLLIFLEVVRPLVKKKMMELQREVFHPTEGSLARPEERRVAFEMDSACSHWDRRWFVLLEGLDVDGDCQDSIPHFLLGRGPFAIAI